MCELTNNRNEIELTDMIWNELGIPKDNPITLELWERLMVQYIRRNSERHANIFVVNATTPAQYFHALRRQVQSYYF